MDSRLLDGLPPDERRELLRAARRRRFKRGQALFHEGDPADTLHLIDRGRVAVRAGTARGDVATLAVYGPGEVVGELALVSETFRRSASVLALEPTETLSVSSEQFSRLRASHPAVDRFLINVLTAQVLRLTERLVEALYVPADVRVLRRLLALTDTYAGEERADAEIPLTQEDLASLAGTSRATTNRVLREAETAGALALGRSRIRVRDIEWLRRKAR